MGIEVGLGIDRFPPRSDDVAGMQNRGRKGMPPCLIHQVGLDSRLLDAVFAEWATRLRLNGWDNDAGTVDPDRTTREEMLHTAGESLDQMLGALQREADHVDDHIRRQSGDLGAEDPQHLLHLAISNDGRHRAPGFMRQVWFPLGPADDRDLMSGFHEPRHQVSPYMPCSPEHYDVHGCLLFLSPAGERSATKVIMTAEVPAPME